MTAARPRPARHADLVRLAGPVLEHADRPAAVGRALREAPARALVLGEQHGAAVAFREPPGLEQVEHVVRRSSSRSRFDTATRLRPTRRPTSSRVRPSSSTRAATARASSTGFRSSRAMFSTIAASSDAASSRRSTIAGTREAGPLRRAPAPLTGDQLVAAALARAHEDRLQHAVLGQRLGERVERRLVEAPRAAARVRLDQLDRDVRAAPAGSPCCPETEGSRRGRVPCRVQPRAATSLASAKYASAPAQCGS